MDIDDVKDINSFCDAHPIAKIICNSDQFWKLKLDKFDDQAQGRLNPIPSKLYDKRLSTWNIIYATFMNDIVQAPNLYM